MKKEEILEKIIPIFKEVFNDDEMDVTMELTSEEIDEWSSVSQVLLLTAIEAEFGVAFKLREVALMNDVATIVKMIDQKLNASIKYLNKNKGRLGR